MLCKMYKVSKTKQRIGDMYGAEDIEKTEQCQCHVKT